MKRDMHAVGMTLCSGIGAPEMAAPWVDWRLASEIERFPREVLKARFGYKTPGDHNQGDPLLWGDMTEVTPRLMRERGVPLPNIIVAGTPCQAFSIAGMRGGTKDARGNLTLKFVETCHAIVNARPDGKLAVLWENVPGVLSDKGNAFGCFLGGLIGSDDALHTPDGGSWPSRGMASGPRARLAWRVLDAQYFGVAQRRRRVFVVVDFGSSLDPAAVLFERQGLHRNTPPSREPREESTRGFETGPHGGRFTNVAPTLDASCQDGPVQAQIGAGVIASSGNVSHCLNAGGMKRQDFETETIVAHTLTGEGFDASSDGTGRGTPIVPVAGALCRDSFSGGAAGRPDGASVGHFIPAAVSSKDHGQDAIDDLSPTLRAGGHNESHANAGVPPAVAFDIRAASGGSSRSHIANPWAVRRLTPTECARLQGFPDDHTEITFRGKPAADGPQYRALGNSMAVPCIAWIMDRMRVSMEQQKGPTP